MSVYLIFFGSEEKTGQVYPSPILEFESQEKLDEWLERGGQDYMDDVSKINGELYGGWPTWHTLTHGDNDDPDEMLDEWLEQQ